MYLTKKILMYSLLGIVMAFGAGNASAQSNPVVGEWKNGSVGSIQYKDRVTGSTTPGRGSVFTYRFLPNGSYEFISYMQSTMYSCTSTLFNQINGKYRVSGSKLILDPAKDLWKSTNSCAASGNRQQTKVPVKKTVEFELRKDEYGAELLCLIEDGGESCFRKATE